MVRMRIVLTRPIIIVLAFVFSSIVIDYSYSYAQTQDCSLIPGSHPATTEDVVLMKAAGITGATVGMCWNPTDQNVGKDDAEAKQYLRSILCSGSQFGGAGPDGTVKGLDSKFAVCAAKFIKSASTQVTGQVSLLGGGSAPLCLREGFRTTAQQQKYYNEHLAGGGIACGKNGVQNCEHPKGIAIDINAAGDANYQKLWAIAPQFNLNFYLKARDKVHFVPTSLTCSGGGSVGPDGTLLPTNYDFPQYMSGAPAAQSPLTGLLNGLRGMLGMQTAPQLQPMTQATQPMQAQTTGQTYYDSSGQPYTYNSAGQAISSVTGQPIDPGAQNQQQTNTTGSTNSNINGQINAGLPTVQNTNTSGSGSSQIQINPSNFNSTSSGSNSTSGHDDIDFINSLANSLAPSSTGGTRITSTSAPARLNQNLQNVQGSQSGAQYTGASGGQTSGGYILPTVLPPEFPQTFGSPNTTGDLTYSSDPRSTFQQVLGRLKGVLVAISTYLTPFGGRAQSQQIID